MLRLAPTSFLFLLLVACVAPAAPAGADSRPLAQWSGAQGGAEGFSVRVVRDIAAWEALWQQLGREPPRPFAGPGEMAVAIFLGERRTGGYRAEVVGARTAAGQLVIDYRESAPAPNKMVTQALTFPWVVTVVEASELPVSTRKVP